ncbi:LOW QUALITY PROTEIN: inositol 1,4,5-trisphosphate receptor-interacting protein-like 1 [Lathamus discolor]|uniref:LOW QUALITY PROTEIN: inositol 1,4,5-trisphosphate receptor-interacting protein-like 1 n=1 Tax=Lathamus discolor TaxID=678569 RepID=UPI0032B84EBA
MPAGSPERPGAAAKGLARLLFWVLQSVFSNVVFISDELDEATRERMQQLSKMLTEEMARIAQELHEVEELKRIEHNGLCCCFSKRSPELDGSISGEEEEDSEEEDASGVADFDTYIAMRNEWSLNELWHASLGATSGPRLCGRDCGAPEAPVTAQGTRHNGGWLGGCLQAAPAQNGLGQHASGRARCCCLRAWRRPCCLPAASFPLLPVRSSLRLPSALPRAPAPFLLPSLPAPLNSFFLLQAMGLARLLFWVLQSICVPMVGDELDEATRERMQQLSKMLTEEMARIAQELHEVKELKRIEHNGVTWSGLLSAALWNWKFWVIAGFLLLLIAGLCCCFSKRSPELDGSISGEEEEDSEEEDASGVADFDTYIAMRNEWSLNELWNQTEWVDALVENLLFACQGSNLLSEGFFLELGPAMGVGSAFDCWSPQEDEPVYRMLVCLKPCRGYTFCLEPGTVANESRIRVELERTCTAQQTVGPMPCFLHNRKEQLRKKQKPRLLHALCTGSYLDVQKTACWFQDMVRENKAIARLLRSRYYLLTVLPSRRSCKVALQHISGRTTVIEMNFVVQLGNSDIFMSSQAREGIFSPSTTWTLTFARAEAKFLWLMFDQTPDDTLLSCLQLCTRMLAGTSFSSYALKTVVMHLLTTTALSGWRRRHFLLRLGDIMRYLRRCLEEKRLDHFFFGNEKIPEEIVLPPALQRAKPFNLFQHLAQDPAAHEQAMREFVELQHRLTAQIFF